MMKKIKGFYYYLAYLNTLLTERVCFVDYIRDNDNPSIVYIKVWRIFRLNCAKWKRKAQECGYNKVPSLIRYKNEISI